MKPSDEKSPTPQAPTIPASEAPQPSPAPAREGPVPTLLPGPGESRHDGADPLPGVTRSKEK